MHSRADTDTLPSLGARTAAVRSVLSAELGSKNDRASAFAKVETEAYKPRPSRSRARALPQSVDELAGESGAGAGEQQHHTLRAHTSHGVF